MYPGRKLKLSEAIPEIVIEDETKDPEEPDKLSLQLRRKRSNSVAKISGVDRLEPLPELSPKSRKKSNNDMQFNNESGKSLRERLKASLNKGGDISDIDKIFEHVINESKRVNESLKAVQTEKQSEAKQSFLKFYENASNGGIDEAMKDFIEVESENKIVKSETYYCTKHGRVKGVLTVADTYIMYDPLYCDENNKLNQETLGSKFQAWIDIKDIVNVDIIKLPNETAMYIQDDDERKWYLYDYYLQFSVSVVNAKTLSKMLGGKNSKNKRRKRRRRPVATVFFRFSHRDKDGVALVNKEQNSIVEVIKKDVENKQKLYHDSLDEQENEEKTNTPEKLEKIEEKHNEEEEKEKSDEEQKKPEEEFKYEPKTKKYEQYQSSTYIPYYDVIPKDDNKELEDDEFELINMEELKGSNLVGDAKESEVEKRK